MKRFIAALLLIPFLFSGAIAQGDEPNAWLKYTPAELESLEAFCGEYMAFLDNKTERECASFAVNEAEKLGFVSLESRIEDGGKLVPGEKIYLKHMEKAVVMYVIGKEPLEKGLNILSAHIDSPRLDAKPNPIAEKDGICYIDTHYYGGIKKYQWLALPLAIHGVVFKTDGTKADIVIGEDESEPAFIISDLLPHLDRGQDSKTVAAAFKGEDLDLIIGSAPLKDAEGDAVKGNILAILKDKYDIDEADFNSAEIEIVPAGKARELGFDRSMIMGYGQDDRGCSFACLKALLDMDGIPDRTSVCILTDKEEIGSVGVTGLQSHYFINSAAELMALEGDYNELVFKRALANSNVLSCDVGAAFDPMYPAPFDKKNAAYLGNGMTLAKYTGSGGKSNSSDATAEYMAKLRGIFDDAGASCQVYELGAVDAGGGGTIAYVLAEYGMNVADAGPALLSMHAPWEVISKADLYESYTAYKAFLLNA